MTIVGAVITITTGLAFLLAGLNMVALRSQSGNTVAELFDQAMGIFCFGMAGLVLLVGLALDRLLVMAAATERRPKSTAGEAPKG